MSRRIPFALAVATMLAAMPACRNDSNADRQAVTAAAAGVGATAPGTIGDPAAPTGSAATAPDEPTVAVRAIAARVQRWLIEGDAPSEADVASITATTGMSAERLIAVLEALRRGARELEIGTLVVLGYSRGTGEGLVPTRPSYRHTVEAAAEIATTGGLLPLLVVIGAEDAEYGLADWGPVVVTALADDRAESIRILSCFAAPK